MTCLTSLKIGKSTDEVRLYLIYPNFSPKLNGPAGIGFLSANLVLDGSTSPAAWCLPPGQVQLTTAYLIDLMVTVNDQFGGLAGDVYAGAEISELASCDSQFHSINQVLSNQSTYLDPIGPGIGATVVAAGSSQAANWPSQPRQHVASGCASPVRQNIPVRVDGFELMPAIVNRSYTICGDGISNGIPPVTLTVSWP